MNPIISPPQRPDRIKLTKETFLSMIPTNLRETCVFENIPEFPRKRDKITLVCPIHGQQPKTVLHILNGSGCKQCGIDARSGINSQEFLKRIDYLKTTLGNLYSDLSIIPIMNSEKIQFTCREHGSQECHQRLFIANPQCRKCIEDQYKVEHLAPFAAYKRECIHYTNLSWKRCYEFIEHYGRKRSRHGYHLDHDFSIREGFDNSIAPYVIGHWCNLYLCEATKNIQKGTASLQTKELLLWNFERGLQINGYYWL